MEAQNQIESTVAGLNRLARNLWWTWNQDAQDVFEELSPRAWRYLYHNAVAVLRELSDEELRARLLDEEFNGRVQEVLRQFNAYLGATDTWAAEHAAGLAKRPVA
ncbi:MAG: starch phosphorylase, partial [Limisphaerales bacterium]